MSVCVMPMVAAKSAVRHPMMATTTSVMGERLKIGFERAIM